MKLPAIDRRTLLIGGGAGVGLVVGFLAWPRREGAPMVPGRNDRLVNAYLRIASDDRVTIAVPQAEVGQGIWTGLAQVAADELGADFARMAVEPAPHSDAYFNRLVDPKVPLRITALGTSIRSFEQPVREAAAAARDLLVRAAADQWSADPRECRTVGGRIVHEARSTSFGAVAEAASRLRPADAVQLRDDSDGRLIGQALPRLDLGAKSDGSFRFASDVRLADMLFASLRKAPSGGRIVGADERAALAQQGCRKLVVRDAWVAAIADSWWAADRALERAAIRREGPAVSSDDLAQRMADAIGGGAFDRMVDIGDYDAAVEGSRPLAATYSIAPLPHHSLDPPSAAAHWTNGRLDLWVATRVPDLVKAAVAKAGGLNDRDVNVYPMPIGDQSGTGFDASIAVIAAELARDAGRPVSLAMSHRDAQQSDRVRPPLRAAMTALPAPGGQIKAWRARLAGMASLSADLADLGGGRKPGFAPASASPPYAFPSLRVETVDAGLPIDTGYWRGGDEALTTFATESFIDEMARAAGMDPFAYRLAKLGGASRLARVLTIVTANGGWDGGGPGSSMGLACASLQSSHIALLATATIGADQSVEVSKLTAAVDCGRVVNPGLVRQQVESGLLAGLAAATVPAPDRVGGLWKAVTMTGRPFERLAKVPEVAVEIVGSRADPGGVSGLGIAVIAPAVANAIFAATGRRLRNLPFDPMAG
ncbi:molybdopterin cofactor-binding domain-containing protein [Sphingomonas jaspsi]|uniref:molybdopterin cofactor-binding domain-containing protein n=1 Tax=Sphingomonas jaspsi TaxID=392409 RepID=UPI0004B4FC16|nr:molybdopterin cofactor-binding domain-containing protein [Sphingomonas jaspsi]